MFSKVLIANRGEIALRVIRTCREMGIKSVAVYSEADKESLHVRFADEAVSIGPPLARKSYLNQDAIIEAAQRVGAEAVHPGYGFLAENPDFTQKCEDAGIVFVGPASSTQRMAGDKIQSRKLADEAGVPVSPGSDGAITGDDAIAVAQVVGYPVIIKASGGGGGRGMRVAHDDNDLLSFIRLSRGEASAAFGNPDLYVEKYLVEPRHIEFQILGDKFGNYVHLGERECSIQKRYQKLVEEAPSPFLDEQLRETMGNAAIAIAKAVGYLGAGTVEFLVDRKRNFYFNEVNSRLQVEHPVTEMLTGIDLVRQQIIIACGKPVEFAQDEIGHSGWSIECRINAEDPDNGFTPSPGIIEHLIIPGGTGVRIDTHLYSGYQVSPFYDSLLGKLVVWSESRPASVMRMRRALSEFIIDGIKTTIPFHQKIMMDKDFMTGNINTHFVMDKLIPEQAA